MNDEIFRLSLIDVMNEGLLNDFVNDIFGYDFDIKKEEYVYIQYKVLGDNIILNIYDNKNNNRFKAYIFTMNDIDSDEDTKYINVKEKYDGIWACSSILHLTKDELENVMNKMTTALKPNGIIYASFKYGNFSGERNGRYFTDMTEETFEELIKKVDGITLEEQWITSDVRVGRGEEKWLNVLLRRG